MNKKLATETKRLGVTLSTPVRIALERAEIANEGFRAGTFARLALARRLNELGFLSAKDFAKEVGAK